MVSVAEELRAASAAVANSWRAAALELPPELEPGMLAPAVLEAYPAAARVVDLAVAQQRLCRALEVGRCSWRREQSPNDDASPDLPLLHAT